MVDRICDNCMSRVPAGIDKCPKCGIRFENTNPGGALPNGWVLGGRYTIGRYLDIDGEGVTYSAIDGNTLQRVLIKEYMPVTLCATRDESGAIVSKPGCEVLFKTTRMDYAELYGILLRLGLVEGLVQVLDVLEANNTAYAVLEKVEGTTLAEYLNRSDAPMDTNRALATLRPVMIGLEALHSANIVHRGISPENIILESGGTAKLGGYATLALRQQGSELKPKLYPGYSAPEQYAASEFGGRYTDVYSFSAVLYRMVTGETPIPADERRMQDNLRPARAVYKEVPAFLSSALVRAMRVVPAERIQTIPDLRLAMSGDGGRSSKGSFGLSKQQLIVGAAALGTIVVLLLVILLISLFSGGNDRTDDSSSISSSASSSIAAGQVPNFVGLVYEDIIKSSNYSDFTFAEPEEEFSAEVPEGRIISQTPAAGTAVVEDMEIKLVVSKGPEKMELPDLVGKTRAEAIAILEGLDIGWEEVETANDGEYDMGDVVKTEPAAGVEVSVGTAKEVMLYIAKEISATSMPNLVGMTREAAIAQLTQLKLDYQETTRANDGTATAGTVAATDPGAGGQVTPGTTTVTIAIYDKFYMPDLSSYRGRPVSDLTSYLDARKIQYNIVRVDNPGTATANTIASITQPPVNSEVTGSTVVTINVYGEAPTPTPTPTPEPTPSSSSSSSEEPPQSEPEPITPNDK